MCDQERRFYKTLEEEKREEAMNSTGRATLKLMDNPVEMAKMARVNHELRNSRRLVEVDTDQDLVEKAMHNDFNSMMDAEHLEEIQRAKSNAPASRTQRRNERYEAQSAPGRGFNRRGTHFTNLIDTSGKDYSTFRF